MHTVVVSIKLSQHSQLTHISYIKTSCNTQSRLLHKVSCFQNTAHTVITVPEQLKQFLVIHRGKAAVSSQSLSCVSPSPLGNICIG